MKKLLLAFLALVIATPAFGQAWTTGPRTPSWVASPTVGASGSAPAYASEPAAIGNVAGYNPNLWLTTGGIDYVDNGEAKFRITCNFSHFGTFDPILYFGQANAGHHHTFIGNKSVGPSSTYTTLRNNPASTCSGGPLNATAYWEPTVFAKTPSGAFAPLKPDVVTFYYTHTIGAFSGLNMTRLPRGMAFIGGVNPADPDNATRNAEIPAGQDWMPAYDGFRGWACYNGATNIPVTTGPYAGQSHSRHLKNADGTDPWGGTCISGYQMIAEINAPDCWDGYNLTSPNGRDHFRYSLKKFAAQAPKDAKCPDGWWRVPTFEVKTEFSHKGWADYQYWYLSSDRMDPNPANWRLNGSTMHFDWMNGWQQDIIDQWHSQCNGIPTPTGGTPVEKTCGSSTINGTQRMIGGMVGEASPEPTFSNNPVMVIIPLFDKPGPQRYGPASTGQMDLTVTHDHN